MKAIKTLLAASLLAAAGSASAAVVNLNATLDSQSGGTLSGTTTFTGYIDVDMTTGDLYELSLTSDGSYTYTTGTGVVTYASGSNWFWEYTRGSGVTGVLSFTAFYEESPDVWVAEYEWGDFSQDDAGDFSGTLPSCTSGTCPSLGNPGWDGVFLKVYLDEMLEVTSVSLMTAEAADSIVSEFSLAPAPSPMARAALAPEVPLPAAAWLFGSGLIGLVGAARRRLGKAA